MDQFARQIPIREGVVDVRRGVGRDLHLLEPALLSAWPMDEGPSFDALLRAIDKAESGGRVRRRH